MLIELAIGDAYGAGFEYADPTPPDRVNDLSRYVKHPRHPLPPGSYTDDTQMSLAIAEAIVSGEPWTREMLARRFVEVFKRDPREGYAQGFYHFLCEVSDGEEFLRKIRPDSDKSGAAMRAAPIGVFPRVEEVLEKTALQAKITHDTPDGVHAAQAAALLAHYFLYHLGAKSEVGRFISRHVPGQWDMAWSGRVKQQGWMSVRAAITAVIECDSMSGLLQRCVAFGGDVDTVASIALAAASCSNEMKQDLLAHLYEGLEKGAFGREYISKLDLELHDRKHKLDVRGD